MNKDYILQLIDASQVTLKQELLVQHPESKYQLLMLHRSFQILRHYIEMGTQNEQQQLQILQDYFQFPIHDVAQSTAQLCVEMQKRSDLQALQVLTQLNQLDLNISQAGS